MFFQSGFSNAIDLLDDSDEEKSSKQDFILACVLVSEYLNEKKKDQHFTSEKGLSGKNTLKSCLWKDLRHFKNCTEWSMLPS